MNDHTTVRLVIAALAVLALAVVVGGIALTFDDKSLPGELIAIGSAAAGSIGAILARGDASSIRVSNTEDDPVPVDSGQTNGVLIVVFVVGFLLGWLAHAAGLFT